jgi:hypothetical protein
MIPGLPQVAAHAVSPLTEWLHARGLIQASQLFGTLVVIHPDDFVEIVNLQATPIVVRAPAGYWPFRKKNVYLTSLQGFVFCVKTTEELDFHEGVILIEAMKALVPL